MLDSINVFSPVAFIPVNLLEPLPYEITGINAPYICPIFVTVLPRTMAFLKSADKPIPPPLH